MDEQTSKELVVVGGDEAETALKELVAEIPMAIHTPGATVVVYGHELVSKKDIEILAQCLLLDHIDKDHGVRIIRFRDDNYPLGKDGKPILANCDPDLGGISVNVLQHVTKAIDLAMDEPERSIHACYHQMMIQSYLHEIVHLAIRTNPEDRKFADSQDRAEEEESAEKHCLLSLFELGKTVDIEPSHHAESPVLAEQLLSLLADEGEDAWADKQRAMLENRIYYHLEGEEGKRVELIFNSFKGYIQLMSGDDPDDPTWNTETILGAGAVSELSKAIKGLADNYSPEVADTAATETVVEETVKPVKPEEVADGMSEMTPEALEALEMSEAEMAGDPNMVVVGNEYGELDEAPDAIAVNSAGVATIGPATPDVAEADQVQPGVKVYPTTGLTPEQTRAVIHGVYGKIFNHIFTQCGRQLNSDIGFTNPEAVAIAIPLTEQEKAVVVKMDCLDANGRWCPNMPTVEGLRGSITKNTKLPTYKLYLNINGFETVRMLIPQNPAKRNSDGFYTKTALQARGGSCIVWVMEANDAIAAAGKKFLLKLVDGQFVAC